MTLIELKQIIDRYCEMGERYHDLRVMIPNNGGGMGGTSATKVTGANSGIDWDSSKFFIFPEKPMIEK